MVLVVDGRVLVVVARVDVVTRTVVVVGATVLVVDATVVVVLVVLVVVPGPSVTCNWAVDFYEEAVVGEGVMAYTSVVSCSASR